MYKRCKFNILQLFFWFVVFICVFGHEELRNDAGFTKSSTSSLSFEKDYEKVIAAPLTVRQLNRNSRRNRQVFFDPTNFVILQNFGTEGGKCLTSQGLSGVCVGFSSCRQQQYFRWKRQSAFVEFRQWRKPAFTLSTEICNFFDPFGRANSGVCCTYDFQSGNEIEFGTSLIMPDGVRPIPAPPEWDKSPSKGDDKEDTQILENLNHETFQNNTEDNNNEINSMFPDFMDENNIPYDPVRDDGDISGSPAVTYDDYRYQWPTQPGTHFTSITGVQQWPPPIPTHPPSIASWPPPLPTHPPGHHYPTHPPSSGLPAHPATTTKAPFTTKRTTTTTRRPITATSTKRPSYPVYPGVFPTYPTYPAHRPMQTTTRQPSLAGGTSGTNEYGLPVQCGLKNPVSTDQERIVGGTNASPHEFPWMAVLFKSGKQFCGGSIITKSHILTAAHCVARMTTWDVAALTAHLGDYNIRTDYEVKHVSRRIKRLVRHKGFDFSHLHNDIAVLTLSEPLKFTHEIQPICLPTTQAHQGRSYSGHVGIVAGWGSLRENGPQPSILQKVQIPIWTNYDCARKYGSAAPGGIIESMLCAGQAARDSCSGDSGGPMIVNENGHYVQVGIVSWGIGCGKGQYPGVYTRVTSLLAWIYKNIK